MVLDYLKRGVSKAACIAAALTAGILAYTANPANAQEPKKPEEPTPIEILVKSYSAAPASDERSQQIADLITAAYQDPELSPEDCKYIVDRLAQKVRDAKQRTQITETAKKYAAVQANLLKAKTAYDQEVIKASRTAKDKDKIAALARAEKAFYQALEAIEQMMPGTQFAQETLGAARRGLAQAEKYPGLMLADEFKEYIQKAQAAAAQAKKEKHPLTELISYSIAVAGALKQADAAKEPEQKIEDYTNAIALLKEAEQLLPHDQFSSAISGLQAKIKAVQEAAKKPEEKPAEQPAKTPEEPKEKPAEKPAETPAEKPGENKPEEKPAEKPAFSDSGSPDKDAGAQISPGKKDDSGSSIADFLYGLAGKRFDSILALRTGAVTEDRGGDKEMLYANLGKALEALVRKDFMYGENAAGNKIKKHKLSGMLNLQPFAWLTAGGLLDYDYEKEWEYLEDIDDNPGVKKVTTTEGIRNYFETASVSTWVDMNNLLKYFKVRIAYFGEFAKNTTEGDKLTVTEDFLNPAGSYAEEEESSTADKQSRQGIAGLVGIMLEPIDKSLRGHISALFRYTSESTDFTGLPKEQNSATHFGLQGKIYDADESFALALGFLQELVSKDEETGKPRLRATSGQATAALDLGTIDFIDDKRGIRGILFGGGWFSLYKDIAKRYGGNVGIALGGDTVDGIELSDLVEISFMRDSRKTGIMPELADNMKTVLSGRMFNNITLRTAGSQDYAGFAMLLNGGAGKAQGMHGKTKTETFIEGAAILDLPDAAFILSGYYADLALERLWGVALKMYLDYFDKISGLAVGFEFNQRTYLPTHELEREIALSLEIPLGSGKKEDKK